MMKKRFLILAVFAWAAAGSTSSLRPGTTPDARGTVKLDALPLPQYQANGLRIAVTPPVYDDIGSILSSMGWPYTEIQEEVLSDSDSLAQFDAIFINCSTFFPPDMDLAATSLEQFVRQGGTLYASDWAYEYIDKAFPGYIHYYSGDAFIGEAQAVIAEIVDPGLASFLDSPTAEINFNLPSWVPVESVEDAVKVYLAADVLFVDGTVAENNPLSVSFAYGDGRVVYTAYHNEGQTSEEEQKLLDYLILITTSEDLSARLQDSLTALGYGMQQETLGSISASDTSPQYVFANPSPADLAVGLNWQEGTLRLSVFKPDGSLFNLQEGSSLLIIEIPDAEAGDWSYQVEAIGVPFDNYPFVVQIGTSAIAVASPTGTVEAGLTAEPNSSTVSEGGSGADRTTLYVVIGSGLCGLLAVALIVGVVIFLRRRRA